MRKFRAWHEEEKKYCEGKASNMFQWIEEGQPIKLEEYTSKPDCKGVDICEGDIIMRPHGMELEVVVWNDDSLRFEINGGRSFAVWYRNGDTPLIKDNINQNPELLDN